MTGLTCTQIVRRPGESQRRPPRVPDARRQANPRSRPGVRRRVRRPGEHPLAARLARSGGQGDRQSLGPPRSLVHGARRGRRRERPIPDARRTQTVYGYERDVDGVYVRRRFSFTPRVPARARAAEYRSLACQPGSGRRPPSERRPFIRVSRPRLSTGPLFAPEAQRRSLTGEAIPGAPVRRRREEPSPAARREHGARRSRDGALRESTSG